MKKLIVIYDSENGPTLPDSKYRTAAENVALDFTNGEASVEVLTGSADFIDELRIQVLRHNLKPTELEFHYKEHVMTVNAKGRMSHWPEGFCDFSIMRLAELARG